MKTLACLLLFSVISLGVVARSAASEEAQGDELRVVVFGAHCDDPETDAGGLIALLTEAGHEVIVGYATLFRGNRKFFGQPEAVVRRREATAACKIMGATPKFFDYAHEDLTADQPTVEAVAAWLDEVNPDIVVTHWPFDTHPNHHVVSSLVWQCYDGRAGWNLYCFEVMTDQQSLGFKPHLYLDIGRVREIKKQASYCHKSQNPDGFWAVHEAMHGRRGAECGVECAEASRIDGNSQIMGSRRVKTDPATASMLPCASITGSGRVSRCAIGKMMGTAHLDGQAEPGPFSQVACSTASP